MAVLTNRETGALGNDPDQEQLMLRNRELLRQQQEQRAIAQMEAERIAQRQAQLRAAKQKKSGESPSGTISKTFSSWPFIPMWARLTILVLSGISYLIGLIPFVAYITTPIFIVLKAVILIIVAPRVFSNVKYLLVNGIAIAIQFITVGYVPATTAASIVDFLNRNPVAKAVTSTVSKQIPGRRT